MANTVYDAAADGPQWYAERIEYLSRFVLPERAETFDRVLSMRTRWLTVCMENTFHPQNASAVVRTCEAFGIQDIYTVENLCKFNPNVNIVRGTDKWIDLRRHRNTASAITALRERGYRIIATAPHIGDTTAEEFDVASSPFAIVFGTEHAGISEEIIREADGFIRIPMHGFVESLNVSASAAILLHTLSTRLRESDAQWRLPQEEKLQLMFRWLMASIRDSGNILSHGFPTP